MARRSTTPSHCLFHQERLATARCSACMKPLCDECAYQTDLGTFCGSECHEKRVQANERVEILRREEEADRVPRMIRNLIRSFLSLAFTILVLVGLWFGWNHLPHEWRAPVEKIFKASPTPHPHKH